MLDNTTKQCNRCKEVKPIEAFPNNKNHKDGKCYNCRSCENARSRDYRKTYPEKVVETRRRTDLKAKYGLTTEDYEGILKHQEGVCAICKSRPSKRKALAVDHNHQTGEVRGLLCDKCNRGIGHFDDDKSLLQEAIDYLSRSRN